MASTDYGSWALTTSLLINVVAGLILLLLVPLARHQVHVAQRWWARRRAVEKTLENLQANQLLSAVRKVRRTHKQARVPTEFKTEFLAYESILSGQRGDTEAELALSEYHHGEGTYLWPADERPSKFRAGYHYRLAAAAAFQAGEMVAAGQFAHYAGHRFRELGEMRSAAEDYRRSAEHYQACGNEQSEETRSARRAIACLLMIAEYDEAREISRAHDVEIPSGPMSPEQNRI